MSHRVGATPDRRLEQLESERDHLLASIADLERERAAGDVDEADFETLRSDYVTRAAQTLRAIEERATDEDARRPEGGGGPAIAPASLSARFRRSLGRRRSRRWIATGAALCLVGLVATVATSLAMGRQPGQSATGSVTLPEATQIHQQLSQASLLGTAGDIRDAVALYATVLREAPGNAEALAYQGWLVRLTGRSGHDDSTVRAADTELANAVAADARYADARAFYGIALLQDRGDVPGALAQFRAFLADHPRAALLRELGPAMARTFAEAKAAVPAQLRRFVTR